MSCVHQTAVSGQIYFFFFRIIFSDVWRAKAVVPVSVIPSPGDVSGLFSMSEPSRTCPIGGFI